MKCDDDKIYFAKIRPEATIPTKKQEDAGYDVYACFDGNYFVIEPYATRPVPTGIASAISPKYYIQVEERSSTGKLGIKRNAGVIDSGYRGEYFILTYNTNNVPLVITKLNLDEIPNEFMVDGKTYHKGSTIFYPASKAICELVVHILPSLETVELSYDDLLKIESERGTGGFGSSGK